VPAEVVVEPDGRDAFVRATPSASRSGEAASQLGPQEARHYRTSAKVDGAPATVISWGR
jgi:hypothetical protein